MIKISFLVKKPNAEKSSLEYITISSPKLDETAKIVPISYSCEVYFSNSNAEKLNYHSINLIDALCLAADSAKVYLQVLINRGYIVSEAETNQPWLLEGKNYKDVQVENQFSGNPENGQLIFAQIKSRLENRPQQLSGDWYNGRNDAIETKDGQLYDEPVEVNPNQWGNEGNFVAQRQQELARSNDNHAELWALGAVGGGIFLVTAACIRFFRKSLS